jgi:hypothetical protein
MKKRTFGFRFLAFEILFLDMPDYVGRKEENVQSKF